MDKEYALMCDCPEIQAGWQPKEGDAVISFTSELVEASKNVFKKIRKGGTPLILHSAASVEHRELCVYKPRIEDVLEWLGDRVHCLFRQSDEELEIDSDESERWGISLFDMEGITEDGGYADTPTKALLKAYMHLCYGKTWDGKAWT